MTNAEYLDANWHEFDANLVYDAHGLAPYYAVYRVVQNYGGGTRARISVDGEAYHVSLSYQESGIGELNHPSSDLDTIREFRINAQAVDDDPGQCSASYHLAPRNDGMVTHDGDEIAVPDDLVGINVRVQGSNLNPDDYLPILRAAWREFGLDGDYLAEDARREDLSNVQDCAAEVRISRGVAGRFHAIDGPINRIANLLASANEGYRKLVADDRTCPGYYYTATVGSMRAAELVTGHQHAKEIKHYYPREPDAFDADHPLHYPKVGVSYQTKQNDHTVRWTDRGQLQRELHEVLLNVLSWADLPVTDEELPSLDTEDGGDAGGGGIVQRGPYIGDAYWTPTTSRRQLRLVSNPTPEIEEQQDAIVSKALRDGMEDSDWDVVEQLVFDGGETAPTDIAEDTGWHIDTIYAALDRLEDLIEHRYGDVTLRSHRIGRQLVETIEAAKRAGETAASAAARLLEDAPDGDLGRHADALTALFDQFGIEIDDRDDGRMRLRMHYFDGTKDELRVALSNIMRHWMQAGLDRDRLKRALLDGPVVDGSRRRQPVAALLH